MMDSNLGQRTIALVLNRDLLFGSRIRSAIGTLGLEPRFVPETDRFVAELRANGNAVAIGIVDMNGKIDWDLLSATLKATEDVPPTLAFGAHVDAQNRRAAKAAGVTRIVSNGQFHIGMVELIDRYRRR